MANIKSAKKRVITSAKRAERNKSRKSAVRTSIKKVYAAIDAKDKAAAEEALKAAISEMDRAGSKGLFHRGTVSRKVSRLTKAVNKLG